MVIPQADVEKQFEYLFGTEVKPQHATITGYGYEFPYDAATKTYHIPVAGVDQLYTAQIYEIEKKGCNNLSDRRLYRRWAVGTGCKWRYCGP